MIWMLAGLDFVVTGWAAAALYFDVPAVRFRLAASLFYVAFVIAVLFVFGVSAIGLTIWTLSLLAVILWWLSLKPSGSNDWQADVQEQPQAEIRGDLATIRNIRDVEYRTEMDYTPRWETRTVDLSQIRGVDLFVVHWGAPCIAHPIVSFQFSDGTYLAMSIEARKRVGQAYSAIRSFFRQYQLIYIVAEERDVVALRTNYRVGENVRLYRTRTKPEDARRLFLQYLRWMEAARKQPQWYNALTKNCTIPVISYLVSAKVGGLSLRDWRSFLNGRGDQMLFELGNLVTSGLHYSELVEKAVINTVAQQAGAAPDFSRRIREGRPGFS